MTENTFLTELLRHHPQVGIWQNLRGVAATEIAARAGFDWLLLDQEHAPRSLDELTVSLGIIERYGISPIIRSSSHDPHEIGNLLDIGAQNLLVPMVETREQAQQIVAACQFAPHGVRGVSSQTRAGAWGTDPTYLRNSSNQICLILQIESIDGALQAEAIISTPGVDAIFIGSADLAATMGHLGEPQHPEVQEVVSNLLNLASKFNKPVGTLTKGAPACMQALAQGFAFTGMGTDTAMLAATYQSTLQEISLMKGVDNDK